jgi:phosphomannomutase
MAMSIFKAYDIRGLYPEEINEEKVRRIGRAFARFLGGGPVGVGRDMRTSSPSLAREFIEGVREGGADAVDLGMTSTPKLYFAVGRLGLRGGANVTASHNPAKYNGLKLCREEAAPIGSDSGLGEIRALSQEPWEPGGAMGNCETTDVSDDYLAHVLSFADVQRPLRVVVDNANGMGGPTLERLFPGLGCDFVPLYMDPDGTFPNHEANPIKPENLSELVARVKSEKADLGASFDGDADRCAFVDEKGTIVPGDVTTALLARHVLGKTGPKPVVYDLRSSMAVEEDVKALGGRPIRERVGHSFIKATMRREGAVFGGELSGHYYFLDNYCADSAVIAFVTLLSILSATDRTLSELVAPIRRYFPSGELNFRVEDKDGMIERLAGHFADGEQDFLDGITVRYPAWWFNVRKSNTEPMLRLNLEGRTEADRGEGLRRLQDVLGTPV